MKRLLHIHLALALFCFPFLSIYAFDGILCAHRGWVHEEPGIVKTSYQVSETSPEGIVQELKRDHGIDGELSKGDDNSRFWMNGGLVFYEVEVEPGSVLVKKNRLGIIEGTHSLHGTAGLNREFGPGRAWGVLVVLVSLGLIVLGLTGMWLWLPRLKERKLGLVFLGVSLSYALGCLILIFSA